MSMTLILRNWGKGAWKNRHNKKTQKRQWNQFLQFFVALAYFLLGQKLLRFGNLATLSSQLGKCFLYPGYFSCNPVLKCSGLDIVQQYGEGTIYDLFSVDVPKTTFSVTKLGLTNYSRSE
ncbi:UNVERIFIED_CONTAM: hypothetical protein K2H54_058523 [Gekko kuhli]